MQTIGKYLKNILVSLDQLLNTICAGSPDETMSSRLGRYKDENRVAKFFAKIVNTMFFWQKDHTTESIEPDYAYKDDILK
jgi:hypothetical protein